jgi:hypothetical protein
MSGILEREIGKIGLKIVERGQETAGVVMLYEWEGFSNGCEQSGYPKTTSALIIHGDNLEIIDKSQITEAKVPQRTRNTEESMQWNRALEADIRELAGKMGRLVAERLQPVSVSEGKRGLDVNGLREKFAGALGRIQTQVETLTLQASKDFDITESMRSTTLQHHQLLSTLQSLSTADLDQSHFSGFEELLETLEKTLRKEFVHLSSLKSQKRPRRLPFKLVQIASDSEDSYVAIYNRTGERREATVCMVGRGGEMEPMQAIIVESEVTLLDVRMLGVMGGENVCLGSEEGQMSNVVTVDLTVNAEAQRVEAGEMDDISAQAFLPNKGAHPAVQNPLKPS